MLNKRKFLISSLLSTFILANPILAQELKCGVNGCHVDVTKFTSSKKSFRPVNSFKKIKKARFLQSANNGLKVTHQELELETMKFTADTYRKQAGEYLEPESEVEQNTIVLAPSKYVMTYEEQEIYNEQQNTIAQTKLNNGSIDLEIKLLENTLPMPLYYCKNNTEPVYDEQLEQFQCVI